MQSVVLTATLAFGFGVFAARATLQSAPTDTTTSQHAAFEAAPPHTPSHTDGSSAEPQGADAATHSDAGNPLQPLSPPSTTAATEVQQPPQDAVPAEPSVARGGRIIPGRLAYVQCAGATLRSGPHPCPRDRDLERLVWAAIRDLPNCESHLSLPGTGDVRLRLRPGQAVELQTFARATSLDAPALLECLRPALEQVETTIRAREIVMSFRFEWRR